MKDSHRIADSKVFVFVVDENEEKPEGANLCRYMCINLVIINLH